MTPALGEGRGIWRATDLVADNPVTNVRPPRRTHPPPEMSPFTEDELDAVVAPSLREIGDSLTAS